MQLSNKVAHTTIWVFLLAMGVFVMYVWDLSFSTAQTSNANVTVNFVYPTVVNSIMTHSVSGSVADGATVPHSPTAQALNIEGEYDTDNGILWQVTAVAYRSEYNLNCVTTPNNTSCINAVCNMAATGDPTRFSYRCSVPIYDYIDTTTESYSPVGPDYSNQNWHYWVGVTGVDPTDTAPGMPGSSREILAEDTSSWFEMGSGIALLQDKTTIQFGTLDVLDISTPLTTRYYSYSNLRFDGNVKAANSASCAAGGTIEVGDIRYSKTTTSYASMTPLTTSDALVDMNAEKYDGARHNGYIFWSLRVPPGVRAGDCQPVNIEVTGVKG